MMNRRNFLFLSALAPVMAKDYISRGDDIYLNSHDMRVLKKLNIRLGRVRKFVGFANFNYLSLNDMFFYGRNYSTVGRFSQDEIKLIEKLFYSEPSKFGFFGAKTVSSISQKVSKKDLVKISHSGHFVFKGKPLEDYKRIIKDVGENIILTSGVRNVVKQLSLYTSKLYLLRGNLTAASRVIAPPAYSYHTISDFDVGKKGWGGRNFTSAFAKTEEFYEIRKLDYIGIRYTVNNRDGVRFEPWHIKVI